MADFEIPTWLQYSDVSTIQSRFLGWLKEIIPNLDVSEGSIVWDFTRGWSMEFSRLIQYNLTEYVKNTFPQFAYGSMLDAHAEDRLIFRKNPIYAFGVIKITGDPGAEIERGTIVMTTAPDVNSSIKFETLARVTIPEEGSVEVEVKALEPGASGNVGAHQITALQVGRTDITNITNEVETSGGADTESDEALYERIRTYDQRVFSSYVGTENDYKLWALEVPGVGSARVEGCLDRDGNGGDGVVHVSITDSEGKIANERLKQAVRDHLESPDDPENKLTAVNAKLVVESPETISINISADIELSEGFEYGTAIETIENEFKNGVAEYLTSTFQNGKIYINEIGSLLIQVYGIADYTNLQLNGAGNNISLGVDQVPVLGEVTLTEVE